MQDEDKVQIVVGIAHLKRGLRQFADQAFEGVPKGSKWAGLAKLWALRTDDNASVSQDLPSRFPGDQASSEMLAPLYR